MPDCDHEITFVEPHPFARRDHYNLYRATLADGTDVIIKQRLSYEDAEVELLHLLKRSIEPYLCPTAGFKNVVDNFRETVRDSQNYYKVVEQLETLSRNTTEQNALVIPTVYSSACDADLIVTEKLAGIRLDQYIAATREVGGPFYDGLEPALGYIPEEIARILCDAWLHLALNCGIVPVDFDARDIVILSANRIGFVGGHYQELTRSTQDRLRNYLIHSTNDDPARALQAILPECVQNAAAMSDIDKLFRQLVPFAAGGWDDDGAVNSSCETIFAQVRLLRQQQIAPVPAALQTMRGLFCVTRLARELSPVRDSFREGIKDLRLLNLLESAREILDPIHWTAQADKFIGLMMLAPKNFDQAIDGLNTSKKRDDAPAPVRQSNLLMLAVCTVLGFVFLEYALPSLVSFADMFQRAVDHLINWS